MYLSEERAEEFIQIASKHLLNLAFELKEKDFCPCFISLKPTTVWEMEYAKQQDELRVQPDMVS